MTESEATKVIKGHIQFLRENWKPHPDYNVIEALGEAIYALEEVEEIHKAERSKNDSTLFI